MDALHTALPPPRRRRLVADPRPAPAPVVAPPPPRPGFVARHRTVVLFVTGLVALDVVVGLFASTWERCSPDDYAARVNGCRERPRDFVLAGGSPVAEGLDPATVAGFRRNEAALADGYALGLPGGTTTDVYHAVVRACPTPPKLLVYGVTASDLNDGRNEPHGPASLMTAADLAEQVGVRPDSREWAIRHYALARLNRLSNLYRYRHAIRMGAATQAERLSPGACPEAAREADELRAYADGLRSGNGYAPARGFAHARFDAVKASGATGPRFTTFPPLEKFRTGSHVRYLAKLADWCRANGTALVLVDMPVTADLEALHPAAFAEYRARLADIERDHGVAVLRATRDGVGLDDTQFADLIHLNRAGAATLSTWLRDRLDAGGRP